MLRGLVDHGREVCRGWIVEWASRAQCLLERVLSDERWADHIAVQDNSEYESIYSTQQGFKTSRQHEQTQKYCLAYTSKIRLQRPSSRTATETR